MQRPRTPVPPEQRLGRRQVGRLCAKLGICWRPQGDVHPYALTHMDFGWSGTALYGYFDKNPISPENLWHELGHWLVASEKDRECPLFGLGARGAPSDIEPTASAVGICLQLTFEGLKPAEEHAETHDWGQGEDPPFLALSRFWSEKNRRRDLALTRLQAVGVILRTPGSVLGNPGDTK